MTVPQRDQQAFLRDISSIKVGDRLRWADPEKVAMLKASFEELGQQVAITVWGHPIDPQVSLSAGLHRLTAAKELGWTKILCMHRMGDELDRELWEIDENLCRAELTPVDKALFVARRKEIYLEKHPETAREASLRRGNSPSRQVGETGEAGEKALRFSEATAKATGQSERSIQRDAERGERIVEEALHLLRGTRLNSGAFLDRLKQIPPDKQVLCVKEAIADEKRKAAEVKENRRAMQEVRHSVRLAHMGFVQRNGEARAGQVAKKYSVIYADPPWQFGVRGEVTGREKGAENHYPTMPTDDICKLWGEIGAPAKADAVLFLWATNPMLPDALRVMEAWGFAYVHHWVWDKCIIGTGYWGRDQHELLLIGRRGNPAAPLPGTQPATVYSETKGPHSAKPVHFAGRIEGLYPGIPKLEMFQRRSSLTDGDIRLNGKWDFWGLEAGEAEASTPPEPESAPVADAGPETDERELYRQAMSILHEGGEWTVAVLQERLGLRWGDALRLFDRIEDEQGVTGSQAVPVAARQKGKKAFVSSGPFGTAGTPSAWDIAKKECAERKASYRATIPSRTGPEDWIGVAKWNLEGYHGAALKGDIHGMTTCGDHIEAIADHLFGLDPDADLFGRGVPPKGNGMFSCLHGARTWLMGRLAAPDGVVPMFGQPGRCLIEILGCRVDFRYEGLFGICGGGAHVVDLDKPFISDTGYQSFQVCPADRLINAGGVDFRACMERICTGQLRSAYGKGKEKTVKLHDGPFGIVMFKGDGREPRSNDSILADRAKDAAWQPGGFLHAATVLAESEAA